MDIRATMETAPLRRILHRQGAGERPAGYRGGHATAVGALLMIVLGVGLNLVGAGFNKFR